jgi:hypothetical protein
MPPTAGGQTAFVVYFEFANGQPSTAGSNTIKWNAGTIWPCAVDANGVPTATNRNMTMIVDRGSIDLASSAKINGAVIAQDGTFKNTGGPQVNGTVLANRIEMGGGAEFSMNDCWIKSRSSVFTGLTPLRWAEIDR